MTSSLPGSPLALLVGRDRELAVVREHLTAALNGRGSLVLIGGEAGVGKTALADTLCREATAQGALVLTGRSFDLTESPPFGAWIDLFAHYRPIDNLPPPPTPFAERGTVGAVASQATLFHAVLDFLAALATQCPLIVLLEDAHWQDAASLDLLRFLAREVVALPVLLLVTYRDDEITRRDPLYQLLPILERESRAARLDLRRLAPDALRALVTGRYSLTDADTNRLVGWLEERASGNTFFTLQLLRALEEEDVLYGDGDDWAMGDLDGVRLPLAVRQVIDGRLVRLDAESQRLLAIAAVIGQEVSFDVWTTVTGADEATLLETVEQATAAHLVDATADGTSVRFVHALIREALHDGILPPRRRAQHRQVGEALATLPQPDPDAVAFHFQRAGDTRAGEWLVRAGERAQAAYALWIAADRYEAALAFLPEGQAAARGWLLYRAARLRRFSSPARGLTLLDEAARLAAASDDRALAAAALWAHGHLACFAGAMRRGVEELAIGADALVALAPDDRARLHAFPLTDPGERDAPHATVTVWAAHSGQTERALRVAERWTPVHADAGSGSAGTPTLADGWSGLGIAYGLLGRPDAARRALAHARTGYERQEHPLLVRAAIAQLVEHVLLPYETERVAERRRLSQEALAAMSQAREATGGQMFPVAALECFIAGHWDDDDIALMAEHRPRPALNPLGALHRARGEWEASWAEVRRILPDGPTTEPGNTGYWNAAMMQRLAVSLALDTDDLDTAREWLVAHDRWLVWSGAVLGRSEGQLVWAQYDRQMGDMEQACAHAERALTYATEPRQPLALLAAHRLLGELDTATGRYEDATRHLNEALRLAAACAALFERGLTLLALAELRAAMGETAEARTLLDEVNAICQPLGAKPILARAAVLAARLTATPTATLSYPAGLSAREVEVLRLVAQGLTNPQVAEQLFLSRRTVEQHLRSVFDKTGAPSRAAAARWAAEQGIA